MGDTARRAKRKVRLAAVTYFKEEDLCGIADSRTLGLVGVTALLAVLSGSFAIPANAGLLGTGPASYCSTVLHDGVQALG